MAHLVNLSSPSARRRVVVGPGLPGGLGVLLEQRAQKVAQADAHDCCHYWATFWADKVDIIRSQEAGGWSSLTMPHRYIEESEIANEGMA